MKPAATEGFLLSPQQRRVVAASLAGTDNRRLVLNITGTVCEVALRAALHSICARHEILRTRFESSHGSRHARQIIDEVAPDMSLRNLIFHTEGVEDSSADDFFEDHLQPFDCESTTPWRIVLRQVSPHESCLTLSANALVADWASLRLLMTELAEAYEGLRISGEEPFQYADYATWQEDCRLRVESEALSSETTEASLGFKVPPATMAGSGWIESVSLEELFPGLHDALIEPTCLAAMHSLVGRFTGQIRPVMGVALDGRHEAEIQGMMGPTEKCLRFDADLDRTFSSLRDLACTRLENGRESFDRHFPEPGWRPEVRYQFLEMPGRFTTADWYAEPILWMDTLQAEECMSILCIRHGRTLTVQVHAGATLVDFSTEEFARYVSRQFLHLCRSACSEPETRVLALPLHKLAGAPVTPDLTQPMLAAVLPPVTTTIHEWVTRTPDTVAVSHLERAWTYRELWAAGEQVARGLMGSGLIKGDRVAILGDRSFGTIASMLGTLLTGGIMVPLDHSLPAERRSSMAVAADVRFLLLIGDVKASPEWAGTVCVIRVKRDGEVCDLDTNAVLPPMARVAADDPAYIFFTSGTSGNPKGILGNHGGLAHFIGWQGAEYQLSPRDRVAQLTAHSFDVVLRDVFLPLCHGATLCLPPADTVGSPPLILGWMKQERISVLHVVPSVAAWWMDCREFVPELSALRWVFFAGEPLNASLVGQWRSRLGSHAAMVNLYGPTETTLAKCHYRLPEFPQSGVQPIGLPLPGAEVMVWNADGTPCAPGEPGEIVIRTPFRTCGYLADGRKGQFGFVPNPFRSDPADLIYRTGDVGRVRSDGLLEIEGRKDDLVKIRGVRVSPAEVEAHLAAQPGIDRCVVLVKAASAQGVPSLLAFVTSSQETGRAEAPKLLQNLRRSLPLAMVPEKIVVLDHLPLTANGKLNRQLLLELANRPALGESPATKAPVNERQRAILAMWHGLFHRSDIGVADNFFDLGGHSLLAAQLAARLRETFLRAVPLGLIFEAPTVEQLAIQLDALPIVKAVPGPTAVMTACGDPTPLSSSQRRIWLQHQLEPGIGAYNIPIAVRITGCLDVSRLRECLAQLVQRHAILRTVFTEQAGEPVQRVLPVADFKFEIADLGTGTAGEGEEMLRSRASAEARQAFDDLDTRPPVRMLLAKIQEGEHVLMITLHHLVGDGWSSVLLLRELAACFNDEDSPANSGAITLPFQYADFARWEQSVQNSGTLSAGLAYWKQRLDGAATMPVFPTDHPRLLQQSRPGGEVTMRLARDLTDSIRQLGRRTDASLFMTLLASFQAYLFRLTGHDDVVVGTPVANRPLPETESLIGCFINTLPLRAKLTGDVAFTAFLQETRRRVLEDFKHLDTPFEEIVRIAQPARRKNAHPMFQVLFNVLNFDPMPKSCSRLQFERVFPAVPASKFDWTVYVREGQEVELQFLYDEDLFDRDRMLERAAGFVDLLKQIVRDPEGAISEYRIDAANVFGGAGRGPKVEDMDAAPLPAAVPDSDAHIQDTVCTVWQRHLRTGAELGLDDDFFDSGGHSLMAMQINHDLERELGHKVPLRVLFEHSTIRSLSRHLGLLVWHAGSCQSANQEWEL